MTCQICQQAIDFCQLVNSDSEEIPDAPSARPVEVPPDATNVCQRCYQLARRQQRYQLAQAKDQICLLQAQIAQFQTQLQEQGQKYSGADLETLAQRIDSEVHDPPPVCLLKASESAASYAEQNMEGEACDEETGLQLALLKEAFFAQTGLLQELFPLGMEECSVSGLRLCQQFSHLSVSFDEVNAGLMHLCFLGQYMSRRRQLGYPLLAVLPAPCATVPVGPGSTQTLQMYFRRQPQQVLKKFSRGGISQNACAAASLTCLVGAFAWVLQMKGVALPKKLFLPSWALSCGRASLAVEQLQETFGKVGVEVLNRPVCLFAAEDFAGFCPDEPETKGPEAEKELARCVAESPSDIGFVQFFKNFFQLLAKIYDTWEP